MKENVLGFDIPVYDITVMHELHRMAGLLDHASGLFLRKTPLVS
jgi:hypothetical protein